MNYNSLHVYTKYDKIFLMNFVMFDKEGEG